MTHLKELKEYREWLGQTIESSGLLDALDHAISLMEGEEKEYWRKKHDELDNLCFQHFAGKEVNSPSDPTPPKIEKIESDDWLGLYMPPHVLVKKINELADAFNNHIRK